MGRGNRAVDHQPPRLFETYPAVASAITDKEQFLAIYSGWNNMESKTNKGLESNFWPNNADRFVLIGNLLCIDFANTVYSPTATAGSLQHWHDLVDFLAATAAINSERAAQLHQLYISEKESCDVTFLYAIELRTLLRKILAAIEAKQPILPGWVKEINTLLRVNEGTEQLVPTETGWKLVFAARYEQPLCILSIIARSIAQLIEKKDTAPVRKCSNPNCVLYFYDISGLGRRRWCSMAVCGNRMKVAAYSRRHRAPLESPQKKQQLTE